MRWKTPPTHFKKQWKWGWMALNSMFTNRWTANSSSSTTPVCVRISKHSLKVAKTRSAVLRSCQLHDGQQLLTLQEALDLIPLRLLPLVEIKSLRNYSRLAEQLRPVARSRALLLCSFDLTLLARLQKFHLPLRWGIVACSMQTLKRAQKMGLHYSEACLDYPLLNPVTMEQLRRQQLRVHAWTVNQSDDMQRMLSLKVDGIISNKPDLVRSLMSGQA